MQPSHDAAWRPAPRRPNLAPSGHAVQAKNAGDLAVFELKSAFAQGRGKLINKLSLVKTYRVAFTGLSIQLGVPGSATSIFAVATNGKANTQVTQPVARGTACSALLEWQQAGAGGSHIPHGKAAAALCCAAPVV